MNKSKKKTETTSTKKSRNELRKDAELVKLLRTADEHDEARLEPLGLSVNTYSIVNYDYKKLRDLIRGRVSDFFEIQLKIKNDNSTSKILVSLQ